MLQHEVLHLLNKQYVVMLKYEFLHLLNTQYVIMLQYEVLHLLNTQYVVMLQYEILHLLNMQYVVMLQYEVLHLLNMQYVVMLNAFFTLSSQLRHDPLKWKSVSFERKFEPSGIAIVVIYSLVKFLNMFKANLTALQCGDRKSVV